MTKKIIAAAAAAAIVFALFHFIPISKKMDLKMAGSIRSADGEVIAPCSVELDGQEQHYLFGKKATAAYSFLAVGFIFLGSIVKSDLAWALQDMFNQLMVLPNVITLFALSGIAAAAASRKNQ
jgi:hypothetical protein